VSVVTRIALDHEDRLGHTLPEIAAEKAGIAKAGCPMVIGRAPLDVRESIARVARDKGASPLHFLDDVADDAIPALPHLPGAYQSTNAEVAWLACRTIGLDAHVEAGLREARWPGRFERLTTPDGDVLLDAAHNEDGALALVASLAEAHAGRPAPPVALVFGSLADKHFTKTLPVVAGVAGADARFYVEPKGRAAAPPSVLAGVAPGHEMRSLSEALEAARARVGKGGLVVVCGSVYLVGEARALLRGDPTDPPVAM
jgi:dihydrofolate synthase/folylpolyglutamate synthase